MAFDLVRHLESGANNKIWRRQSARDGCGCVLSSRRRIRVLQANFRLTGHLNSFTIHGPTRPRNSGLAFLGLGIVGIVNLSTCTKVKLFVLLRKHYTLCEPSTAADLHLNIIFTVVQFDTRLLRTQYKIVHLTYSLGVERSRDMHDLSLISLWQQKSAKSSPKYFQTLAR